MGNHDCYRDAMFLKLCVQVQPYLQSLELMLEKIGRLMTPTQVSIEGPFKSWLKKQEIELAPEQLEKGV